MIAHPSRSRPPFMMKQEQQQETCLKQYLHNGTPNWTTYHGEAGATTRNMFTAIFEAIFKA